MSSGNFIIMPSVFKNVLKFRMNNVLPNFVNLVRNCSFNYSNSYYSILGVKPDATEEEIKQAYYALSKKYHPDMNIGNENAKSKILEINAAFEVLGNKEQKSQYDSKMFPKVWEKNSFIYDHKPKEDTEKYIYRRIFKQLQHPRAQFIKHVKGEYKRKMRHADSRYRFDKSQSHAKFSKVFHH